MQMLVQSTYRDDDLEYSMNSKAVGWLFRCLNVRLKGNEYCLHSALS